MAGVLVNKGEERMLAFLVNKSGYTLRDLVLCLYKSNTTPAEADTLATYTEADFTGYTNITLVSADWTIAAGAPSTATGAAQTFTSTANQAAQNIYGYFLKTATDNELIAAERFTTAPIVIQNDGDSIQITPFGSQD